MTLQTNLLDLRLAHAAAAAQQAAAAAPSAGNNTRSAFELPHELSADLQQTLRQFSLLQRERAVLESALAAAPAEQRGQALLCLTSFDADLTRLLGRAALLVFFLLALRHRSGEPLAFDGAHAVQQLSTVFGQTPDPARVRGTVQRLTTQPMGAVNDVEPSALTEVLFIALALVIALAPRAAESV
jgi:hypothetical protein